MTLNDAYCVNAVSTSFGCINCSIVTEVEVVECRYMWRCDDASSARRMRIHDTNNAQNMTSTSSTNAPTAGRL